MADRPYQHRCWKGLRAEVLARDGHDCQIRDPGCTGRATHVDHIVSWRMPGGSWFATTNLRAACAHCNLGRSNEQAAQLWLAETEVLDVGPSEGIEPGRW